LQLEQVRVKDDAEQARRLQALLGFKEKFISRTVAAQVIGTGGSDRSRIVYIDKGGNDGIKRDMPVITADGIVGKVLDVVGGTSQVLLINDQTSGAGAILEQSRLQGILRGTAAGDVMMDKVMSDETVQPGDTVLTSGGDRIFPKGLKVGAVIEAGKGKEAFLNIRVKPAANLSRLEEVLVITQQEDRAPSVSETGPIRAIDILAERLPSVPQKPPDSTQSAQKSGTATTVPASTTPAGTGAAVTKPKAQPDSAGANPSTAAPGQKPANKGAVKSTDQTSPSARISDLKPAATPTEHKSAPVTKPAEDEPQ
jgi:rod shape-determining protein MreC